MSIQRGKMHDAYHIYRKRSGLNAFRCPFLGLLVHCTVACNTFSIFNIEQVWFLCRHIHKYPLHQPIQACRKWAHTAETSDLFLDKIWQHYIVWMFLAVVVELWCQFTCQTDSVFLADNANKPVKKKQLAAEKNTHFLLLLQICRTKVNSNNRKK